MPGRAVIPVAGLRWLATAPEIRGRGLGAVLLRRAERLMVERGAVVGLLLHHAARLLRKAAGSIAETATAGSPASGRYCRARPDGRLSQDSPAARHPPVRRMEILDLARIYRLNTDGTYGPLERTEAYWHWLVNRKAYDEILVAIDWENTAAGRHPRRESSAMPSSRPGRSSS